MLAAFPTILAKIVFPRLRGGFFLPASSNEASRRCRMFRYRMHICCYFLTIAFIMADAAQFLLPLVLSRAPKHRAGAAQNVTVPCGRTPYQE
jgi:hypothetical protein